MGVKFQTKSGMDEDFLQEFLYYVNATNKYS